MTFSSGSLFLLDSESLAKFRWISCCRIRHCRECLRPVAVKASFMSSKSIIRSVSSAVTASAAYLAAYCFFGVARMSWFRTENKEMSELVGYNWELLRCALTLDKILELCEVFLEQLVVKAINCEEFADP